jgi:hypothetical protein
MPTALIDYDRPTGLGLTDTLAGRVRVVIPRQFTPSARRGGAVDDGRQLPLDEHLISRIPFLLLGSYSFTSLIR